MGRAAGIVCAAVVALGGVACGKSEPGSAQAAPVTEQVTAPAPTPEPPKEPTLADKLAETKTLSDALALLTPLFKDTQNANDDASVLFAVWSSAHLQWADINALPETKHALVMKDPENERGKRNCYAGSIVEIHTDRSMGRPIYRGGLATPGRQIARFVAVGSTGELVQSSQARFCGVVTGVESYSNAGGGTTHAVRVIGMFDLPENKPAVTPSKQ